MASKRNNTSNQPPVARPYRLAFGDSRRPRVSLAEAFAQYRANGGRLRGKGGRFLRLVPKGSK